jgi:predicted dehydrogenase
MKRIVILGCENSHADSFIRFIQTNEAYKDVKILGVYSDDRAAAEKLHASFGVPVMADYADAVGEVDGVIITARHGDNHYKYAKPYIPSGVPMFIDKPITISEDEAIAFMRDLTAHGVRVSGGSSLRHTDEVKLLKKERAGEVGGATISGYAQAPLYIYEEYGGFYFYAQHLVEMVCEVFGRFPLSVMARKNGKQIHVIFHYANYDCVGVYSSACGHYHIARTAIDSMNNRPIPDNLGNCFYHEFKEYHELLHGEAQTATYEEFFSPVFVLNAIDRALTSGKEEVVHAFAL